MYKFDSNTEYMIVLSVLFSAWGIFTLFLAMFLHWRADRYVRRRRARDHRVGGAINPPL